MRRHLVFTFLMGFACVLHAADVGWKSLAPGMDLAVLTTSRQSALGDARINVLRIDPEKWELAVLGISETEDASGHTAREWSRDHRFAAVINAGMFATDYRTHIGYQRSDRHVNSAHVTAYQSVAAFAPKPGKKLAPFHIFDLDTPGTSMKAILADYTGVVQNLRLIKAPGDNRWGQQPKQWSEAALGEDKDGRILFIFARTPFSMHDFNQELLAADIGIVAAQHLEGGPEAQLYIKVGSTELEWFGSYETGFYEKSGSAAPWPIPNVLGVRAKSD